MVSHQPLQESVSLPSFPPLVAGVSTPVTLDVREFVDSDLVALSVVWVLELLQPSGDWVAVYRDVVPTPVWDKDGGGSDTDPLGRASFVCAVPLHPCAVQTAHFQTRWTAELTGIRHASGGYETTAYSRIPLDVLLPSARALDHPVDDAPMRHHDVPWLALSTPGAGTCSGHGPVVAWGEGELEVDGTPRIDHVRAVQLGRTSSAFLLRLRLGTESGATEEFAWSAQVPAARLEGLPYMDASRMLPMDADALAGLFGLLVAAGADVPSWPAGATLRPNVSPDPGPLTQRLLQTGPSSRNARAALARVDSVWTAAPKRPLRSKWALWWFLALALIPAALMVVSIRAGDVVLSLIIGLFVVTLAGIGLFVWFQNRSDARRRRAMGFHVDAVHGGIVSRPGQRVSIPFETTRNLDGRPMHARLWQRSLDGVRAHTEQIRDVHIDLTLEPSESAGTRALVSLVVPDELAPSMAIEDPTTLLPMLEVAYEVSLESRGEEARTTLWVLPFTPDPRT